MIQHASGLALLAGAVLAARVAAALASRPAGHTGEPFLMLLGSCTAKNPPNPTQLEEWNPLSNSQTVATEQVSRKVPLLWSPY